MSDFRVVDRRNDGEEECKADPQEHCGCQDCGGCMPVNPIASDAELFQPGTIVESKFTGEQLMVIKAEADVPVSYVCRTFKLEMVRMFDFELVLPESV